MKKILFVTLTVFVNACSPLASSEVATAPIEYLKATDSTVTGGDENDQEADDDPVKPLNTPPSTPFITIFPAKITQPTTLYAVIVTPSTDADGDPITYTYAWHKNGLATGITGSTVAAEFVSVNDLWQVVVTPHDGFSAGEAAEVSRTVSYSEGRIGLGFYHVCAITADTPQKLKCWGDNFYGQFGYEYTGPTRQSEWEVPISAEPVLTPTEIPLASTPATVEAGFAHTCVIDANSEVWCFGSNVAGQLGVGPNNATGDGQEYASLLTLPPLLPTRPYWYTDPLTEGDPHYGDNMVADQIAAGWSHTCILTKYAPSSYEPIPADGKAVWCWGWNYHGQLGLGFSSASDGFITKPTWVSGVPATVKQISGSSLSTTCAVAESDVYCWGQGFGPTPVTVPALSGKNIERISMTSSFYAIDTTGNVYQSFAGEFYQLATLTDPMFVSRGSVWCDGASCVTSYGFTKELSVVRWVNKFTESYPDSNTFTVSTESEVSTFLDNVSEFKSDGVHSCAFIDSRLSCWGKNEAGELGRGFASPPEPIECTVFLSDGVTCNGPTLAPATVFSEPEIVQGF